VSFHLADDGTGNDIVFIEGEAAVDATVTPLAENAPYVAKYADWIASSFQSPEHMAERYSVPIVIRPVRGRSPY
jgi:hypothetical protein